MRIEEDDDGARVAVQWVPEDDPVPGRPMPEGNGLSKELDG